MEGISLDMSQLTVAPSDEVVSGVSLVAIPSKPRTWSLDPIEVLFICERGISFKVFCSWEASCGWGPEIRYFDSSALWAPAEDGFKH